MSTTDHTLSQSTNGSAPAPPKDPVTIIVDTLLLDPTVTAHISTDGINALRSILLGNENPNPARIISAAAKEANSQ